MKVYSRWYLLLHLLIILSLLALVFENKETGKSPNGILLALVFTTGLILASLWWRVFRLRRWAKTYDCTLLKIRMCPFWNNPFGVSSAISDNLLTYKVTVLDHNKVERNAWVKFGKFWYPSLYVEDLWESAPGDSFLEKMKARGAYGGPKI